MTTMSEPRLSRTRQDLSDFLRNRRAAIRPQDVGLPPGTRRRTPGLRREEIATLAGVGLSWYTWLEQGRDIRVSAAFLDNVARALKMSAEERRHLYLLARQSPPATAAENWCVLQDLVRRMLDDLSARPAFVMNLRWDVLGWNVAAEHVFGFETRPPEHRNMLWMYFIDEQLSGRVMDWPRQAPQIVASFRRDHAHAVERSDMHSLVEALRSASASFRRLWDAHGVEGRCEGRRGFLIDGIGEVAFDHATLVVDQDRHLRLIYYAARPGEEASATFERAVREEQTTTSVLPQDGETDTLGS